MWAIVDEESLKTPATFRWATYNARPHLTPDSPQTATSAPTRKATLNSAVSPLSPPFPTSIKAGYNRGAFEFSPVSAVQATRFRHVGSRVSRPYVIRFLVMVVLFTSVPPFESGVRLFPISETLIPPLLRRIAKLPSSTVP